MKPDEAFYWLQCSKEDAVFCIGCGSVVHRDFADISADDEAMCHECVEWHKISLDNYGL